MRIESEAIVCAVRAHGEHNALVRVLTPRDGLQVGYVRGGRARRLRPVLLPGNTVQAELRARTDEQLAYLTAELVHSRAFLLGEPLAAAALAWVTALTAAALPEGQPYPRLFGVLEGVLGTLEAAPSARGWAPALIRYELFLLAELGFGLDLYPGAGSGVRADLAFVSPRSGRAVTRLEARGYEQQLLPLPPFLLVGGAADYQEIAQGLALTGHFLARDLLIGRQAEILAARERLVERLQRNRPVAS